MCMYLGVDVILPTLASLMTCPPPAPTSNTLSVSVVSAHTSPSQALRESIFNLLCGDSTPKFPHQNLF